jgi:mannosyltransferase
VTVTDLEGSRRPDTTDGWGPWRVPFALLVGGALVCGLVLRFVARSPLWLDEALSVNISRLPISQIPGALRHDGHPPLYYVLLHGWMDVFGDSNQVVRAFSGVWGVIAFPLLYVAAKRLGGTRVALYAIVLFALSPYAVRYATETRMYSMEMVLALVGWLLATDALRSPKLWRLGCLSLVVGALLWTHYWAMWFLIAAGLGLLVHAWRARRRGDAADQHAALMVVGAIAVGGLLFLPWLPALLYQGAHTGTPWARPVRPTEMVTFTLADLGGGPQAEAIMLGWVIAGFALLGLLGRAVDRFRIELDLRTRPVGRPLMILIGGTLAMACVVGYATGATYASRYAAIFVPFLFVLAAIGLDQIRSRPIAIGLLAALVLFGGVGSVRSAVTDRSDAKQSADAIKARAKPGDLVVFCPDQLGPSTSRVLGKGLDEVTYPDFERPQRVDWVDYTQRLDRAKPAEFVRQALERAGGHQIFFVFDTRYITHKKSCTAIYNAFGKVRPPELLTQPTEAFEPSTVALFALPPQP